MFSLKEKQFISKEVEKLLLGLNHPEMPKEKPVFTLRVEGKEDWSWAEIKPNWTFGIDNPPVINPFGEMITKLAVKWLCRQLKRDKGLWYSYQSNIAMTIYDNIKKYFPLQTAKKNEASPDPLNEGYSPTLHEFCNICANDFLELLTR